MNHAPDNWDNVAIEDFGEIIGGGTPSRANASLWKGSIPWVTPSEITSLRGKFVRETKEKITPEGLTGSAAKLLPVGSLLVTTRATMGEMAIAAVPLTTNQGFKNIIPNESTDSLFAYYQIRMLKADMVRLASGTTFLEISKADFSRIRTNRPKHPEQRRIAFVLDTMDEAIAKTEAVIAKLKQVRAGLLHDLLTRGLDENDQLRDPIAHPEQFQDSPLGCIPRDWVTAEIATLCDLGRGRVISQLDLEKNPGIYPVYSSQSANEGVFGYLGTFDFDGDYVTWTTDGANAGTVFFRSGRFNCTNVCGTLQSRGEIIESFLAHMFSCKAKKFVSYVGNPKLMNNTVARIWIGFPRNIAEQKAIVRSLLEIDGIILIEKLEQEKLMMIESGLMADLLTGCVRVPEGVEIIAERQKGEHQEP